ncbi:hypothetical protein Cni_G25694 [Canna indica]|uniref:Uncharacterized protein n=1 Tax=Canna indica TaxID=4628 RepID=A0AAQ3QPM7_9LILI|nr:hypothetical protein Cni_G25694 [Canna indica]
MLGSSLQRGRRHGDERFYSAAKACRGPHQDWLRSRNTAYGSSVLLNPPLPPFSKEKPMVRDRQQPPESRTGSRDSSLSLANRPEVSCNLERFLVSTTPAVPAQYFQKTKMTASGTSNVEYRPYFILGDLWTSFREWSAYGVGIPLVLDSGDHIVQYYVPYLSGIQLYGEAAKQGISSRILCNLRREEESDSDCYQDLSSDVNYDGENFLEEGSSSDDGDSGNSEGCLLFEYLEEEIPYLREPLADKVLDLACQFPELLTLRSYDLLPASWISVAWYPIYRIPTGPTLKDLDACFLTYHSLSTPLRGAGAASLPLMSYPKANNSVPKISIPAFGLASYKFKNSLWTSTEGREQQLAISLLQAADNWMRLLQVDQPDYRFFVSDGACRR